MFYYKTILLIRLSSKVYLSDFLLFKIIVLYTKLYNILLLKILNLIIFTKFDFYSIYNIKKICYESIYNILALIDKINSK